MVVAAWGGCKRPPAPAVAAHDGGAVSIAGKTVADAARPSREVELRSFLWDWVATQNNGNFAGYRANYSAAFQGLDRTKKRVRVVKAAAWMQGQQRLFAKPQSVTIRDEQTQVAGEDGELRFIRAVDSGTYHEEGWRSRAPRRVVA
jgi:hypothetical protein